MAEQITRFPFADTNIGFRGGRLVETNWSWSGQAAYYTGDIVIYEGTFYQCKADVAAPAYAADDNPTPLASEGWESVTGIKYLGTFDAAEGDPSPIKVVSNPVQTAQTGDSNFGLGRILTATWDSTADETTVVVASSRSRRTLILNAIQKGIRVVGQGTSTVNYTDAAAAAALRPFSDFVEVKNGAGTSGSSNVQFVVSGDGTSALPVGGFVFYYDETAPNPDVASIWFREDLGVFKYKRHDGDEVNANGDTLADWLAAGGTNTADNFVPAAVNTVFESLATQQFVEDQSVTRYPTSQEVWDAVGQFNLNPNTVWVYQGGLWLYEGGSRAINTLAEAQAIRPDVSTQSAVLTHYSASADFRTAVPGLGLEADTHYAIWGFDIPAGADLTDADVVRTTQDDLAVAQYVRFFDLAGNDLGTLLAADFAAAGGLAELTIAREIPGDDTSAPLTSVITVDSHGEWVNLDIGGVAAQRMTQLGDVVATIDAANAKLAPTAANLLGNVAFGADHVSTVRNRTTDGNLRRGHILVADGEGQFHDQELPEVNFMETSVPAAVSATTAHKTINSIQTVRYDADGGEVVTYWSLGGAASTAQSNVVVKFEAFDADTGEALPSITRFDYKKNVTFRATIQGLIQRFTANADGTARLTEEDDGKVAYFKAVDSIAIAQDGSSVLNNITPVYYTALTGTDAVADLSGNNVRRIEWTVPVSDQLLVPNGPITGTLSAETWHETALEEDWTNLQATVNYLERPEPSVVVEFNDIDDIIDQFGGQNGSDFTITAGVTATVTGGVFVDNNPRTQASIGDLLATQTGTNLTIQNVAFSADGSSATFDVAGISLYSTEDVTISLNNAPITSTGNTSTGSADHTITTANAKDTDQLADTLAMTEHAPAPTALFAPSADPFVWTATQRVGLYGINLDRRSGVADTGFADVDSNAPDATLYIAAGDAVSRAALTATGNAEATITLAGAAATTAESATAVTSTFAWADLDQIDPPAANVTNTYSWLIDYVDGRNTAYNANDIDPAGTFTVANHAYVLDGYDFEGSVTLQTKVDRAHLDAIASIPAADLTDLQFTTSTQGAVLLAVPAGVVTGTIIGDASISNLPAEPQAVPLGTYIKTANITFNGEAGPYTVTYELYRLITVASGELNYKLTIV